MFLEIGAPYYVPTLKFFLKLFVRFRDRKFTCDQKISNKLIQSEYEELYMGP
jgi:hypothetical protein